MVTSMRGVAMTYGFMRFRQSPFGLNEVSVGGDGGFDAGHSRQAGCRLLLSEDLHEGFTWAGVTVVNPFSSPRQFLRTPGATVWIASKKIIPY